LIGNFLDVGFEREVAGIVKDHLCRRDIPTKRLRPRRNEERIVLTPGRQQGRLILAEVFLERRV